MPYRLTVKDVEQEALGALSWIEGYTEPQTDRPQVRVVIIDSEPDDPENSLRVAYREHRHDLDGQQLFKITVNVEAVGIEAGTTD